MGINFNSGMYFNSFNGKLNKNNVTENGNQLKERNITERDDEHNATISRSYKYNDEKSFWLAYNRNELGPGDYGTFVDDNGALVRFYMVTDDNGKCFATFEYGYKSK